MVFKKNDLEEKLGFSRDERKLIMDFQKKIPILTEDADGFCVNARDLHMQLGVGRDFSTWIKTNLEKAMAEENTDYILCSPLKVSDVSSGFDVAIEYKITLDMSKEIAMFTGTAPRASDELKQNSKMARKYFILMEKAVNKMLQWNTIRNPEKASYKTLCSELNRFLQRNYDKCANNFDYVNEANSLNLTCLGATAKEIREYLDVQDKQTREHLTSQYNEYLYEMQKLDIMYLRMNMQKLKRYDLIKQGFKVLYPNASFIIAKEA